MIEKVKFEGEHANTVLAKNLFLYDKKKKDNLWLVCADVNNNFDMKDLNKYLPVKNGDLRGADLETLEKVLGCRKGLVNYFSIINDTQKAVKVIMDKRLIDAERVSFHPMDNTASTSISQAAVTKIKELAGRDDTNYEVLDFTTITSADGPAKPQSKEPKPQKQKAEQGKKLTAEEKKQKKELEKA